MVPKVAGKGRSFVGAGLYYLHDKKAATTGRVAFTHTENLPTRDPDKAIKCMAWTAMRQQQLKARAGGNAKGRKLEQPVYCYSLSWSPGEEPSHAEMLEAAMDTVKALGLPSAPREQKSSKAGKETTAQRAAAFREQAKDTTEQKKNPSQGREGTAEKFRKARDANPNEKPTPQRRVEFRENANDASRDIGRSRSRTIKPPGGRKPD